MAETLKKAIPGIDVELVDGGRGDFIVNADGNTVWDKRNMGDEFPDNRAIVDAVKALG